LKPGKRFFQVYRKQPDLVFEFGSGENIKLINDLKGKGIPVVSVFLTGRPLWVNPHLNASDAFVVAWLPGTEAGGVADVILGDKNGGPRHDFKGKLSFSWPADGTGKVINAASDDGVLYPFGYGLNYADTSTFKSLSEDPGISNIGASFDGKIINRGDAAKQFGFFVGDSSNLNTPVTALTGASLGGGISVQGTDYKAQEDSRILTWSGDGKASVSIRTQRPLDLSKIENLDTMALHVEWRLDDAPDGKMVATMGCGDGCSANLDISDIVSSLPKGKWAKSVIPLACFQNAGLKIDNIKTVFQLTADSQTRMAIYDASLGTTDKSKSCPRAVN